MTSILPLQFDIGPVFLCWLVPYRCRFKRIRLKMNGTRPLYITWPCLWVWSYMLLFTNICWSLMHVAPLVLELQHQGGFSAGTCLNAPETLWNNDRLKSYTLDRDYIRILLKIILIPETRNWRNFKKCLVCVCVEKGYFGHKNRLCHCCQISLSAPLDP